MGDSHGPHTLGQGQDGDQGMNSSIDTSQSAIKSKLSRKMTLQALLIALVAILGIGFASVVIEQFLVREALNREAVHFWEHYEQDNSFRDSQYRQSERLSDPS